MFPKRPPLDLRMAVSGVKPEDVAGVKLAGGLTAGAWAAIHPSTVEAGRWQLTWFDALGPWGHTTRDTVAEAVKEADWDGYVPAAYFRHDGTEIPDAYAE